MRCEPVNIACGALHIRCSPVNMRCERVNMRFAPDHIGWELRTEPFAPAQQAHPRRLTESTARPPKSTAQASLTTAMESRGMARQSMGAIPGTRPAGAHSPCPSPCPPPAARCCPSTCTRTSATDPQAIVPAEHRPRFHQSPVIRPANPSCKPAHRNLRTSKL